MSDFLLKGYLVQKPIGSGSFGSVYLASDKTGALVVLKVFTRTLPKSVSRKEIEITSELTPHRNLVRMRDSFEVWGTVYLALDYVGKDNLLTFINREGSFTETSSLSIFEGILSGLQYLHDSGIVHRDIKCENIFLTDDLTPVVGDLGFATHWSKNEKLNEYCGSLHYAAPEILQNIPYTGPETDIWSAGVVLYALNTGLLPWMGTDEEIVDWATTGDYILPDSFSEELIDLLDHMLDPSPIERWTITEIKESAWCVLHGSVQGISGSTKSLCSQSQSLFGSGRYSGRALALLKSSDGERLSRSPRLGIEKLLPHIEPVSPPENSELKDRRSISEDMKIEITPPTTETASSGGKKNKSRELKKLFLEGPLSTIKEVNSGEIDQGGSKDLSGNERLFEMKYNSFHWKEKMWEASNVRSTRSLSCGSMLEVKSFVQKETPEKDSELLSMRKSFFQNVIAKIGRKAMNEKAIEEDEDKNVKREELGKEKRRGSRFTVLLRQSTF